MPLPLHPKLLRNDIGTLLERQGIAIRTGHRCAQPVMDSFNVPATTRASLACYNTYDQIDDVCREAGCSLRQAHRACPSR